MRVKLLLTNFSCIAILGLRRSRENIFTSIAHPFIHILYTIDHYMALTLLLAQILDCVTSYDKMEERKRRKKGESSDIIIWSDPSFDLIYFLTRVEFLITKRWTIILYKFYSRLTGCIDYFLLFEEG